VSEISKEARDAADELAPRYDLPFHERAMLIQSAIDQATATLKAENERLKAAKTISDQNINELMAAVQKSNAALHQNATTERSLRSALAEREKEREKDGERLDWLGSIPVGSSLARYTHTFSVDISSRTYHEGVSVRAAIDAAMSAQPGSEKEGKNP
jgi:hypothetical protein